MGQIIYMQWNGPQLSNFAMLSFGKDKLQIFVSTDFFKENLNSAMNGFFAKKQF